MVDDYHDILKLPHTPAEGKWLEKRLETISARETIALSAAMMMRQPITAAEAINILVNINRYTLYHETTYDGLGQLYLKMRGAQIPESVEDYINTHRLGELFEDENYGIFVGRYYVAAPKGGILTVYNGTNLEDITDGGWVFKARLTTPYVSEGVWIRLPALEAENSYAHGEMEAALEELGVKYPHECAVKEILCSIPGASLTSGAYDNLHALNDAANAIAATVLLKNEISMLVMPEKVPENEEKVVYRHSDLTEFGRLKLRELGVDDELIATGAFDVERYAQDILEGQGFMYDSAAGGFTKPAEEPQQVESQEMSM